MLEIPMYGCAYRGNNGDMCAIGVLIEDQFYDFSFETKTVFGIADSLPKWVEDNGLLLHNLQGCHDNTLNWLFDENMKIALTRIAEDFDLDYTILKNLSFKKKEKENGNLIKSPSPVLESV